ncbi:hypothetical protein AAG906_014291 [Vitis piasezkii]
MEWGPILGRSGMRAMLEIVTATHRNGRMGVGSENYGIRALSGKSGCCDVEKHHGDYRNGRIKVSICIGKSVCECEMVESVSVSENYRDPGVIGKSGIRCDVESVGSAEMVESIVGLGKLWNQGDAWEKLNACGLGASRQYRNE